MQPPFIHDRLIAHGYRVARIALALLLTFPAATVFASTPHLGPQTSSETERDARRDAWRADWREVCVVPGEEPGEWRSDLGSEGTCALERILGLVRRERTIGLPLLSLAHAQGVAICRVDCKVEGARGLYDVGMELILLDSKLNAFDGAIILAHELRHADVIGRGVAPSPDLSLMAAIRLHLAMEADAHMVGTLFAWEAAQAGKPHLWDSALHLTQHDDVASVLGSGAACVVPLPCVAREGFLAWFKDEDRVAAYRLYAAMAHLDEQEAAFVVPGRAPVDPDLYVELGLLPNGKTYDAHPPNITVRRAVR